MMQTLLTQMPSAPTNGLDNAPLSGSVESKGIDGVTGSDSKGDFAILIAKVQSSEQGMVDSSQSGNSLPSAKSLATESGSPKEKTRQDQDPDADGKSEEVSASDFLLRLQDSLQLDTSLATPSLVVIAAQNGTAVDGKPLPQREGGQAMTLNENEQTTVNIARQFNAHGPAESPLAMTDKPLLSPAETLGDISSTTGSAVIGKEETAQAATQGAALKAFGEGIKQPDAGSAPTSTAVESTANGSTGKGAEKSAVEGSQQPATATSAHHGAAQRAQVTTVQSAVTQSTVTPSITTQSDGAAAPVMVAPQQMLAQAESQGPQAPLSSIAAGIRQMEVTGSEEVRKAVLLEVKPKAGEADKSLVAMTSSSESSQSQNVQHGQNSPPQPQVADSRAPAAETTLRRETQHLPHLKLAGQEAPAELHEKVNVMLAEKLQQAELQLDPIGLGKMKIQIQIGADSQANVHFVVQHGQTREMLEQAMPRLREMLAGQGIQLGQTQVQQQSQQSPQQQGQSTFAGQGQSGQGSSGQGHSGHRSFDGEVTTTSLNVSVESPNDSGIDFYA